MNEIKCENCRHGAQADKAVGAVVCRRFPPQLVPVLVNTGHGQTQALQPFRPTVAKDDNCGEFSPKDEATQ